MFKKIFKNINKRFNYSIKIKINSKKFTIPVLSNSGLPLLLRRESWMAEFLKYVEMDKNGVFIDVGVNIGQTLLFFKSLHNQEYIGFEPNSNCNYYTQTLIEANNIKSAKIIPVGLSYETNILKILMQDKFDEGATIVNELRPGRYDTDASNFVPVFKFDDIEYIKDKHISYIKIDVEGAEPFVIEGMLRTIEKYKPIISSEVLDCDKLEIIPEFQERVDKMIDKLKTLAYKIYRIQFNNNSISLKEINNIELKLWTDESKKNNDYVFIHNNYSGKKLLKLIK